MSEQQLIDYTEGLISKEGLKTRRQFTIKHSGIIGSFHKRGMMDRFPLPALEKHRRKDYQMGKPRKAEQEKTAAPGEEGSGKKKEWNHDYYAGVEDKDLIAKGQNSIDGRRLESWAQLSKANGWLANELRKRGLQGSLVFVSSAATQSRIPDAAPRESRRKRKPVRERNPTPAIRNYPTGDCWQRPRSRLIGRHSGGRTIMPSTAG